MASAKAAGLRYVTDGSSGIRRHRRGKGFVYVRSNSKPVRSPADLRRIRRIVIPPAWTEVWISAEPKGHLQAVGRDARGQNSTAITRSGEMSATGPNMIA
jgi:DNA topoisomerase-1